MTQITDPAMAEHIATWLNERLDESDLYAPFDPPTVLDTRTAHVAYLMTTQAYASACLRAIGAVLVQRVYDAYAPIIQAATSAVRSIESARGITQADVTRTEAWIAVNGGTRRARERRARGLGLPDDPPPWPYKP